MSEIVLSPKQHQVIVGLAATDKRFWNDRWVILSGPVRSGKTHSSVIGFLGFATNSFRNSNFIVAARQFRQIKANVRPAFAAAAKELRLPFKWQTADSCMRIGSNYFWCFDASNQASVEKIQGITASGAYLDEVALMPEFFVKAVGERCSEEGAKIVGTCNPREPTHWLKRDYIDRGELIRCKHISFELGDNPKLSAEYVSSLVATHTGTWLERNVLGKWVASEGLIWPHFTICDRPDTPASEYYVSVDAADRTVTHCLLVGRWQTAQHNKLHVVGEWFYDASLYGEKPVYEKCEEYIDFFVRNYEVEPISWICDRYAYAELATLRKILAGKAYVEEAPNIADSRNKSIEQAYLWLTNGSCTIDKSCLELIRSIEDFTFETQNRKQQNRLKTDHGADALRNVIFWRHAVKRDPITPRMPDAIRS